MNHSRLIAIEPVAIEPVAIEPVAINRTGKRVE
jgi:hypothetical protein